MIRFLTFLCLLTFSVKAISQSKLVAVTKSELTGITLPTGSKQDKRILSTAGAKTLLQMTAEENAIVLEDKVEVLSLPPATKKEAKLSIQNAGWELVPIANEPAYFLLKNKERTVLMYLESSKNETALYFMPVKSMPQQTQVVAQQVVQQKQEQPKEEIKPQTQTQTQPQPQTQTQTQTQTQHATTTTIVEKKVEAPPSTIGNFTFTSTNFDDGWVSTIDNYFVKVTKGATVVRVYYGESISDEMRNSNITFAEYYWNQLVVPNYSVKSAVLLKEPGYTYFRTYFMEGDVIDPKTNKPCYLALNVLVNSGVATSVLAIAPDKNSYYQQFPEPKNLGAMTGYNKFAVGLKDIVGPWTANSGSAVNLYNTTTGAYAGMNSTQSSDSFVFNADGTYSSKHAGASSVYGTNTYYTQEYKGKLTVTNWDMSLTNRFNGTTENFNIQFEAVRGGRVLHLQLKSASGIQYHLVRNTK